MKGLSDENLAPIGFDVLYSGMVVDYGIYYLENDMPVLLCKNVVLNDDSIKQMRRMMGGKRNVYMDVLHHEKILEGSQYLQRVQRKLESVVGYDKVRNEALSMIDTISSTGVVSEETINQITESIGQKISSADDSLILQCLNGVRLVDEYLYTHSANVGMLNGLIAKWLKLPADDIKLLIKIGLVHDIGKLRVPPEVLNKPSGLSALEFASMKNHSTYSRQILVESGETDMRVLDAVAQHHEKMNGNGYPFGLHSDDISYFARITSVSDVYDAMIAKRVYKKPHSPFEIFEQFANGRFSDLDITIVDVFLKNMPFELTGKAVLMSNGAIAKVAYVNPQRYLYPMVSVDDGVIQTTDEFYCVSMYVVMDLD